MKFTVISSSPIIHTDQWVAYAPYARELRIWAANCDEVTFMCPVWETENKLLTEPLGFVPAKVFEARSFTIKGFRNILKAFAHSVHNFRQIYRAMHRADHIHLRCPGNIGLMGCLVQMLFPHKPKTAKYAGNWDPKASQPWSYKLQRYILSNTFLTKNMQVLVYGEWPGQSRNIRPFFTATYREKDKLPVKARDWSGAIRMNFVGTLAPGKRPLYALQLAQRLRAEGMDVRLDVFGEGKERPGLERYIRENKLDDYVFLRGNLAADALREELRTSHFTLLPSKSEGWPKAVAEAMFWGSIPLATDVSCVRYMLGEGTRGLLLKLNPDIDCQQVMALSNDAERCESMIRAGVSWSRQFTLDLFEAEISRLLHA